jgi:5-methylcytosine-specific restriction endonuclease McrA
MSILFPNLATLDQDPRKVQQKWELPTRDQENAKAEREDERRLEAWRSEVFRLDAYTCQCCHRTVKRMLKALPDQAQAHHVSGRIGALRHDVRNGLTLCRDCHRRVTGMVADKLRIIGTQFFRLKGVRYINARFPVTFKKVA